jgi:putative phosphoesterase
MRLAILSDVHGNLPALQAVLADARRQQVSGVIVAGDLVGGPGQRETVDLLRDQGSLMIRGNCENYLLAFRDRKAPEAWWDCKQWAMMRWAYSHLREETLDFLASLPEQRVVEVEGRDPIHLVHGSPRSVSEHLFPQEDAEALRVYKEAGILSGGPVPAGLDELLGQVRAPVLVCGHSHIPWREQLDGLLVVNAGSVGAPNNGDWRPQYVLLTWQEGRWQAEHRIAVYDLAQIRRAYRQSGLLEAGGAFARACLVGIETGQNVPGRLVDHVYRVAREMGWLGGAAVPDRMWEAAVATFDWHRAAYPQGGHKLARGEPCPKS